MHGFKPEDAIIQLQPSSNGVVEMDQIVSILETHGHEIALIMFGGVNYYTGQVYDMKMITEKGHEQGCVVGFDLAHAAGNVPVRLHEWGVDFACWCSYKYLNSGPGAIAGLFVHEKHFENFNRNRLEGWWGQSRSDRFKMTMAFRPSSNARSFQLSNPCILSMTALYASLLVFSKTSIEKLNEKSKVLSGYLRFMLEHHFHSRIEIITPITGIHGAQLSLKFKDSPVKEVFNRLCEKKIITDKREPDVIRVSPAPLYNSFEDCFGFIQALEQILK
jgi:kynureninase